MSQRTLPFAFLVLVALALGVKSDGILSIKFIHFDNPGSLKSDSTCCDGYDGASGVCSSCEYMFKLCVTGSGSKPCSLSNIATEWLSNNNYYLFQPFFYIQPHGESVSNPMQVPFKTWNNSFLFKFTLLDEDNMGATDHISTMERNITINATRSGTTIEKGVVLEGEKRTTGVVPMLTAQMSVSCNANYLIPSCSDYCVNTDDASGHYICNFLTGKRDCHAGWYGERCDKKKAACSPRNDTKGHYTCETLTGRKICLPGWRNAPTNCTEEIIKTPTVAVPWITATSQFLRTPSLSAVTQHTTKSSDVIRTSLTVSSRTEIPPASVSISPSSVHAEATETLAPHTEALHKNASMTPSAKETISTSTSHAATRVEASMPGSGTTQQAGLSIRAASSTTVPWITATSQFSRTPSLSAVTQHTTKSSDVIRTSLTVSSRTEIPPASTVLVMRHYTASFGSGGSKDTPVVPSDIKTAILSKTQQESSRSAGLASMAVSRNPSPSKIEPTNSTAYMAKTQTPTVMVTTLPTLDPNVDKMKGLGKVIAFIVSIGLFILLSSAILLVLKLKNNKKNHVKPIKLSNRYQQHSAYSQSSRHSKATSSLSIHGLVETRIGAFVEPKRLDVDGVSSHSGRSQGRWRSGNSEEGLPHQRETGNKLGSFVMTTNPQHFLMPKEAYLLVPTDPCLRPYNSNYK